MTEQTVFAVSIPNASETTDGLAPQALQPQASSIPNDQPREVDRVTAWITPKRGWK